MGSGVLRACGRRRRRRPATRENKTCHPLAECRWVQGRAGDDWWHAKATTGWAGDGLDARLGAGGWSTQAAAAAPAPARRRFQLPSSSVPLRLALLGVAEGQGRLVGCVSGRKERWLGPRGGLCRRTDGDSGDNGVGHRESANLPVRCLWAWGGRRWRLPFLGGCRFGLGGRAGQAGAAATRGCRW